MDIKRAKQEIRDSIEAYLAKDAFGDYRIPAIRQRPILLMGPPGIGKTQIMEQIAKECGINLVAYTITHHTRQSAVGLPYIREKEYDGRTVSVTEYTMSEIIASVYEKIEKTGIREGILFLDEINCVSETLAPTMLQFLQGKTFGNQAVPKGWVIVTAGNPPEYNKSVREFDVVTLDRIRRIDVEENFEVWKEYAYLQGIHPAVISYLELRRKNFYRIENTVDGKNFVTARGWEDLSGLIQVYELLGKKVDREVVYQYIQYTMIAKDFANYLQLFYKYKKDYAVEDLLRGTWDRVTIGKIKSAALDEHLSIVGLLSGRLGEMFAECYDTDAYISRLHSYMVRFRDSLAETSENRQESFKAETLRKLAEDDLEQEKKKEQLTPAQEKRMLRVLSFLERAEVVLKGSGLSAQEEYERMKEMFREEADVLEEKTEQASEALEHVFDFLEEAFGESQEMVAFLTELNANYYSIWFIRENGSDQYYRYNKGLLFDDRQKKITGEMDEAERLLNLGIKNHTEV